MCFKRLCKCVFDACCPNFFVPENNMCMHKVVGASREALLSELYDYYETSVACLLFSPSLNSILAPAIYNPLFVKPFTEGHALSQYKLEKYIFNRIMPRIITLTLKKNVT